MTSLAERVLAVEAEYAAAGIARRPPLPRPEPNDFEPGAMFARAAAAAVASRYLAVGTPRSFGLVFDGGTEVDEAILTLETHRTWFAPTDIRCARCIPGAEELADRIPGARAVEPADALAADIVCVMGCYVPVAASAIRRGTHINVNARMCIREDLQAIATVFDEAEGLPKLAAGLVDGRQLDEITVFYGDGAAIARAMR